MRHHKRPKTPTPKDMSSNEEITPPKTPELKESIKKPKAIKSIEHEEVKESLKPSFFERMKTKLEALLPEEKFIDVMKYIEEDSDEKLNAKVQTAFRFNPDLIERLKARAKRENRSLNNYVEKVLMDIVYDEPNEETIAAMNWKKKVLIWTV